MPTLDIGGKSVTVGDEFLKLTPQQQNDTVDEIATSLGITGQKEQAPITASGLAKAADIGLQEGVAGLASLPRTALSLGSQGIQGASNWLSRKLGLPEDTRDLSKGGLVDALPTYESALATIQDPKGMFGGKPYTPQN